MYSCFDCCNSVLNITVVFLIKTFYSHIVPRAAELIIIVVFVAYIILNNGGYTVLLTDKIMIICHTVRSTIMLLFCLSAK